MRWTVVALVAALALASAADAPFNKEELEAILKAEHSQKISNVYDSTNDIQYTWNIEAQELCPGVDGTCSKEEL